MTRHCPAAQRSQGGDYIPGPTTYLLSRKNSASLWLRQAAKSRASCWGRSAGAGSWPHFISIRRDHRVDLRGSCVMRHLDIGLDVIRRRSQSRKEAASIGRIPAPMVARSECSVRRWRLFHHARMVWQAAHPAHEGGGTAVSGRSAVSHARIPPGFTCARKPSARDSRSIGTDAA